MRDRVRVTIRGAAPERVLSACASRGIQLSGASPVEDCSVSFQISSNQVGELKSICEKNQCIVVNVIQSRTGRLLRRGRRRWPLALLHATACLLSWLSSLFIWELRVTGNEKVSAGEILRAMEDCGVGVGTFWPKMNIDIVRAGVQRRVPELEWFTVNLRGSVAQIDVRERVDPPELLDNDAPYDLVAVRSGIIVNMRVLQGQPLVQRGALVTAGQTLVSGSPEDIQGEHRGVHALGSVRVRTAYCLTAKTPLSVQRAVSDAHPRTRLGLQIGKMRVFFGKSSSIPGVLCDKLYAVSVCAVPGLVRLPVSLVREDVTPLALSDAETPVKAARARLEQTLLDALQSAIGADGKIVSKSFAQSVSGGVLTVTLRCECEQEIADERPCTIPEMPKGRGDHT